MSPGPTDRIRGVALLVSGIVAVVLIVYLLLSPGAFTSFHPIPLLLLLVLTTVVAFWQAREQFR